ncbi:hypothetical protein [Thermomonas fusca]|uniref:Tetratricopeptide repeat protein n=1 Tax=Thermomonas fusca TaxID=215690 RepID=A0A5R9PBH6_9GAMM|nr:hypothetical protein [Thermomonas fusca]TLX20891.1 hypothetical protein E5S66_11810 [Thermomonas fusca]
MTQLSRGFLFLSAIAATVAGLLFLAGLPGGFVFDDAYNIAQNPGIQLSSLQPGALMDAAFSAQPGSATRVLPMLTFALDFYRGDGMDPATFKITNIAIHALTTVVLAWFLRALFQAAGLSERRAAWTALALAFAWAAHPLQVSSVLYVVQRMQTLSTLFLLLALWSYLQARIAQIQGRPGRAGWLLGGLFWAVAFSCKEDAIALPAYALAMELTVLRFNAKDASLARNLRRGYLSIALLGGLLYLLVVAPYFWSWGNYPTRDFSSVERLLSQGRVLCLYLWEILLPLPSHMPFYYDWLPPSRGLLSPWTTLPSLLGLAALMGVAWHLRRQRPLFALGIFLFFGGHFVTSNVIGLELAFEHRNHFPMIGILIAAGDLIALATRHLRSRQIATSVTCAAALVVLAGTTVARARTWNSELSLANTSTILAPQSARAWNSLCVAYFELGGGAKRDNPNLDKAIAACGKAADVGQDSIKSLTNIIAFKALRGPVPDADWNRYLNRLRHVTMTPDNSSSIWVILNRARDGMPVDGEKMLEAIDIINERARFKPIESAAMGYFILGHTGTPERAYPYFAQAVLETRDPAFAASLTEDLRQEGYPAWAERLELAVEASRSGGASHRAPGVRQ